MQGLNSNNCIQCFSIKNKKLGFSLIELSIVLIIIGLLVAGITGGQSLIESAKIRAAINEINGFKQGTLAFYAAKGRLPGDIKNIGATGSNSGYTNSDYPAGTFASPYHGTCAYMTAPFVELYLEGLNDYYIPSRCSGPTPPAAGIPHSKYIGADGYYWFLTFHRDKWNYASPLSKTAKVLDNIKEGSINLYFYDYGKKGVNVSRERTKTIASIDKKIDDGIYNSGSFRGSCATSSISAGNVDYDEATNFVEKNNSSGCGAFLYNLGF